MHSNLPKAAQESAKFSVRKTLSRNSSFGLILSRINTTQLSFMMINQINDYLNKNSDLDIQLYTNQNEIPIEIPLTGLFNYSELMHHSGPIIACDPGAVKKLPIVNEGRYYYYVYDPRSLDFEKGEFFEFLKNSGVSLIVRNKDHAKILKMLDVPILSKYVPDCNIELLREIVVE